MAALRPRVGKRQCIRSLQFAGSELWSCQGLTSHAMLRKNVWGARSELVVGVVILIVLLAIAFAAGYVVRDLKSRKRRAEARRWTDYAQPDWLNANAPANTNEVTATNQIAGAATGELGQLGQMLDRWETRARARRVG